jgi:pyruvate dehydrogenase E1 component
MPHDPRLPYLAELERKVLWLSTWMIHNANHRRDNPDGLKVAATKRPRPRFPPL